MTKLSKAILCVGAIVASAALASYGQISGNLSTTSVSYGSPLAVQSTPTGFGDATTPGGDSVGGSELDAGYGTIAGGNLYLFLAGNFENNGNHVNVFIGSSDVPGQNVLNIGSSTEAAMNGSTFSPGFNANYMIDANDYGPNGAMYVDGFSLPNGGVASQAYLGSITMGAAGFFPATTFANGLSLALVNTNIAGVTGSSVAGASAVGVGMELAIPLSLIGNPSGAVMVMADVNGGSDGYLSNQFLPGLPNGTGNLGGGGPYTGGSGSQFNFGSTPGEYMTVVPEPSSIALVIVGLLGAIGMIRRRNA
ncbi:MAG: PEP-CTERM sorting domain-containing protein [Verrucomicrobiia bacterium]|jgi:hypothetical protein